MKGPTGRDRVLVVMAENQHAHASGFDEGDKEFHSCRRRRWWKLNSFVVLAFLTGQEDEVGRKWKMIGKKVNGLEDLFRLGRKMSLDRYKG